MEFKVGDSVRVIKTIDSGVDAIVGDIGTIDEITNDITYPVNVKFEHAIEAMSFEELQLV